MKTQSFRGSSVQLILLLVTSISIAFYNFGPMVDAQLSLIDDHEIIRFRILLGQTFDANHFLVAIQSLPDFYWGEQRGRPVYYFLRLLETQAWLDSSNMWYFSRISQFALMLFLAGVSTYLFLGEKVSKRSASIIAAATIIFFASSNTFNDIVNRLGPSELYVATGIMIFIFGILKVYKNPSQNFGWWTAAFGLIIAIGSKENTLIFGPSLLIIFIMLRRRMRLEVSKLIPALIPLLLAIYLGSGVALGSFLAGKDIYQQGRSIQQFTSSLALNPFLYSGLLFCGILFVAMRSRKMQGENHRPEFFLAGTSLALIFWETYFYQAWPFTFLKYSRYELVSTIALLVSAIALIRVAATFSYVKPRPQGYATFILGSVLIAAFAWVAIAGETAFSSRTHSMKLAKDLAKQHSTLAEIYQMQADSPGAFVMMPREFVEYEPLYALPQFINFYTDKENRFFLDSSGLTSKANTAQEHKLFDDLRRFERLGQDTWNIRSADGLTSEKSLNCLLFGEDIKIPLGTKVTCSRIITIPLALPL